MKKILVSLVAMMFLVVPMAFGLSIYPGLELDKGPNPAISPDNSNSGLKDYLYNKYGLENPLYKSNVDDGEEGPFMGSYNTEYFNSPSDPTEATISWVGPYIVEAPAYLVVKDGRNSPFWYLFDLTFLEWDGTDALVLTGFWSDGNGAISHVELYGARSEVPEPATLLLFGAGIAGLALYRRKRS
ncbi:PEP-CTERM sorting domain-containing protein [Pelovirga terrestris]|uniref:PEP-CTERM sorting domain-containing protein n=1 Tax=Pelovirga terrestris TaxID=2771352 RepID=A0A8J6UHM4_9BACT|nr:PEP-CTERM sorting domain-containing protein [Pelovirga terrestris]MBD1399540.1 PEP-CTERM sorting domain-containing protein [Pelovirga terrestris]